MTKILKQNSHRHKRVEQWTKRRYKRFREFRTPFPLRDIRKNPRSMYARVPQAIAQFALKIENLSHISWGQPLRAYSLRPRLWLLVRSQLFNNYWIKQSMIARGFFLFSFVVFAHVASSGAVRLERKFCSFPGCLCHSDRRHSFCSAGTVVFNFCQPRSLQAHAFRITQSQPLCLSW